MSTERNDSFEILAGVLFRCWIFGFVVLLFWLGAVLLAGDFVLGVHADLFGLTESQLRTIHYCGMGLTKLVVGLFFFIPWVSLRIVLNRKAV